MKAALRLVGAGLAILALPSCDRGKDHEGSTDAPEATPPAAPGPTLAEARRGFETLLLRQDRHGELPDDPPPWLFDLVQYPGPLGEMAAYLSPDPDDGARHPLVIWLTGGFSNSIGEIAWDPGPRENDQSAATFREAGLLMMYPSLRGGNDNPGSTEGLYGEVEDVLAAARYAAAIDYVDPSRIYLAGHSTGGSLALLVAESSDLFRAVFAFGPTDEVAAYGAENVPFDVKDGREAGLRAPAKWLHGIKSRTFVFEGEAGNRDSLEILRMKSTNPLIQFHLLKEHDHFDLLAPVSELIAERILRDTGSKVNIDLTTAEILDRCNRRQAPPRPSFPAGRPGPEQVSFEFALYYPTLPAESPFETIQRTLNADFPELQWEDELPARVDRPTVNALLIEDVAENYAPPDLDGLRYTGKGLSSEEAQALQGCEHALIITFLHPGDEAIPALRVANRLLARLAADTGGFPWDDVSREVFSPAEWQRQRVEGWKDEIPNVVNQITIHSYRDPDYLRAITLGMGKFGLPDVVVDQFAKSDNRPVGTLLSAVCQLLLEGAAIGDGGDFALDLKAIRNETLRTDLLATLEDGATGQASLALKRGGWNLGDPINDLIEISCENHEGADLFAQQKSMLSTLFGSHDSIVSTDRDDAQLQAASERARARLPELRQDFNRGLQPGAVLLLKAPFATSEGGTEWMWVEVSKWVENRITGLLQNDPFNVPDLHAGQEVEVDGATIYDYLRSFPDGRSEGNETGLIMQQQQDRKKQEE